MTERYQKRGIRTGPPLVAGIYRQLNVGMDAFSQCKKVVDTPFPWPYAQCVMVAIIFFMVSFPVQVNRTLNYVLAWVSALKVLITARLLRCSAVR